MREHFANAYFNDSARRESNSLKNKLQPPVLGPILDSIPNPRPAETTQQAPNTVGRGRQPFANLGPDYDFVARSTAHQFDDIIEPFASLNDIFNEVANEEDNDVDTNLLFTQTIHDDSDFLDSVYSMEIDGPHPMNLFGDLGLYFNLPLFGGRADQTDDSGVDGTIIESAQDDSANVSYTTERNTEANEDSTYRINLQQEYTRNFNESLHGGSESEDDIERQLQRLSDNIMEKDGAGDEGDPNEKHRRDASLTTDQSEASSDSDMMSTIGNERYNFSDRDDMSVVSAIEFVGRKRNRW